MTEYRTKGYDTISDRRSLSQDKHKAVREKHLVEALFILMSVESSSCDNTPNDVNDHEREVKAVAIETLECSEGASLYRLVGAVTKSSELENELRLEGKKLKKKHRDQYVNETL